MVTKVTSSNFSSSVNNIITAAASIPTISNVQPTDSSYTVSGLTVLDPNATAYVKITGTNFSASSQVFIESTLATTVTYISSTQLNVVLPSKSTGSYVLYVVNSDGSVAIRINAVTYSTSPVWSTSSSLPDNNMGNPISIQLAASSDSNVVYAVSSGSLPPGLSLSSGGLLSGTVSGLSASTTYNFTVTATDIENQANNRAFSITVTANDPLWSYTALMVNSEPSATPFISDASTNNLGLVINGDTKANKFSPYYGDGYYSNYFDGTSDYLSLASNTAFAIGTGDYTLEFWVYSAIAYAGTVCFYNNNSSGYFLQYAAGTGLQTGIAGVTSTGTYATTLAANTWYHIAVARASGSSKCFVNGVQVGTAVSDSNGYTQNGAYIGALYNGGQTLTGYISNLRLVKGTALYTSNFTTSTTPLTTTSQGANASQVSLLTCQSNKLIDKSTNNFAITKNGDTIVSPAIPFAANSSYATYGSAYFDGTGDYLSIPSSVSLVLGQVSATIEFWIYPTNISGYQRIVTATIGGFAAGAFCIRFNNGTIFAGDSGGNAITTSGMPILLNQWNHVAWVGVSGSTQTLYVNGVNVGTSTTYNLTTAIQWIGGYYTTGPAEYTNGYVSDVRIIKGTALYTANFTPSTTPLTAIANTQLLTVQYNGSATNNEFLDQSSFNNLLTRAGNSTQGSFSPYSPSGWSVYFDGASTQYFTLPTAAATAFGGFNNNYTTIEFWAYQTTTSTTATNEVLGTWAAVAANGRWYIEIGNGAASTGAPSKVFFTWTTSTGTVDSLTTTAVVPVNQWVHIAIVINATVAAGSHTVNIYINGTGQSFTARDFSSQTTTYDRLRIAGNSSSYFYGYLSNLRIVRATTNIVGYTGSTITPPTTPFVPAFGTVLLTCQSNRFMDVSPYNLALTPGSTPTVQAFSPFSNMISAPTSYSINFNGSSDYIAAPSTAKLGTGDFTVEAWIYLTAGGNKTICSHYTGSTDYIFATYTGVLSWLVGGASKLAATSTLPSFTWHHVAAVRSSNVLRLYLNGVQETNTFNDTYDYSATGNVIIGNGLRAAGIYFSGYISNLRLSSTALYTSSFTPSTAPLTVSSSTILLACQSNSMSDVSNNKYVLTPTGTPTVYRFNPFGNTVTGKSYDPVTHGGSMYFDGNGDYIRLPVSPIFSFPSDYTVEFWVNFSNTSSSDMDLVSNYVSNVATDWIIMHPANATFQYYPSSAASYINGPTPVVNRWYHVAAVRSGTTCTLYVDGISYGSLTFSGTLGDATKSIYIGSRGGGTANFFNGYMSDVRILHGKALYTGNFQPPVMALSSITDASTSTVLMLSGTNGGVVDTHSSKNIETIGNAQISTAIKKYGTASMYFDGSGDRLMTTSGPTNSLGSGDFTIEFWIYSITLPANARLLSQGSYTTGEYLFIVYSSGAADFCEATTARLSFPASSFVTATWQHIAIVRSGTTIKGYVNGTSVATATSTYNYSAITNTYIGSNPNTASQDFNGYLDELRITKYARYTSNFTAPTSAFITR